MTSKSNSPKPSSHSTLTPPHLSSHPISTKINRGHFPSTTYFCTLTYKQGRIFSIRTHPRILILFIHNDNKPHTIAYLENNTHKGEEGIFEVLPPWKQKPRTKYQKQLQVIKDVQRSQKIVRFMFRDQKEPWDIEFKSQELAFQWIELVKKYMNTELSMQTECFEFTQIQSTKESNNKMFVELQSVDPIQSFSLTYEKMNQIGSFPIVESKVKPCLKTQPQKNRHIQEEDQFSKHQKQNVLQSSHLRHTLKLVNRQSQEQEHQFQAIIETLELDKQMLSKENTQLKANVQSLKEELAKIKLNQNVLVMFKEQASIRYEKVKKELERKRVEEKKMVQICKKLIYERAEQSAEIDRLKKELAEKNGKQRKLEQVDKKGQLQIIDTADTSNELQDPPKPTQIPESQ